MNSKITQFSNHLITYDYILFGGALTLFVLFVILALLFRKKVFFAVFFIFFGFGVIILAPTLGYLKMHDYLFKNTTILISQKKLTFTQAIVVKGSLTNDSKRVFTRCKVTATTYKSSTNKLKNYIYKLKPLKKKSIFIYDVGISKTENFKLIIEPFTYQKNYNISLGANCR